MMNSERWTPRFAGEIEGYQFLVNRSGYDELNQRATNQHRQQSGLPPLEPPPRPTWPTEDGFPPITVRSEVIPWNDSREAILQWFWFHLALLAAVSETKDAKGMKLALLNHSDPTKPDPGDWSDVVGTAWTLVSVLNERGETEIRVERRPGKINAHDAQMELQQLLDGFSRRKIDLKQFANALATVEQLRTDNLPAASTSQRPVVPAQFDFVGQQVIRFLHSEYQQGVRVVTQAELKRFLESIDQPESLVVVAERLIHHGLISNADIREASLVDGETRERLVDGWRINPALADVALAEQLKGAEKSNGPSEADGGEQSRTKSKRGQRPRNGTATKEVLVKAIKNLSDLDRDILEVLLSNNAVTEERRMTTEDIAAGTAKAASSHKRPVTKLRKRKLVETKRHCGGGVWLTALGINAANLLRKQRGQKR